MEFNRLMKVILFTFIVLFHYGCFSNKLAAIQTTLEKKGATKFKIAAIVQLEKIVGDRSYSDAAMEKPLKLAIEYIFSEDSIDQQNAARTFLSVAIHRPELFKKVSNEIFVKLQPPSTALDRFALEYLAKAFLSVNDKEPFRFFNDLTDKIACLDSLYNYSIFMSYGNSSEVFPFFVKAMKRLHRKKTKNQLWRDTLYSLIVGLGKHGAKAQKNPANSKTAIDILRAVFYEDGVEHVSKSKYAVADFYEALEKVTGDFKMTKEARDKLLDAQKFEVVAPIMGGGKDW